MENFPLLGMGTWGMGGTFERDDRQDDIAITALKRGLNLGIKLIDTAEFYGAAHTEEIVGEAIAGYPREELCIISKVWKTNLQYDNVIAAAKKSLERLRTDYIDLYLIHWPNEAIPIEETMRAMEYLVDKKIVRSIGVSNFSPEQMSDAMQHLDHTRLFADQTEYNLLNQAAEKALIPYSKANNIHVIAYRPLAKGNLTQTHSDTLTHLAKKYKKTTNQIALNWLISQDITAIPKTVNLKHLEENAGAIGWKLSREDIVLLRNSVLS